MWDGKPCDVMIALHARKSHAAMAAYRRVHPHGPLVVCLTGTDVYHDLARSALAQRSLDWADRIVVLQARALGELRPGWRAKGCVIHQSAPSAPRRPVKHRREFRICVLGHLRAEKDPLRAARALVHLPQDSRIRVLQAGRATSPAWATRATQWMRRAPHYRWLGEVSRLRARRLLASSHAMVISSRLEGGANVVSEAIVLGVPVLASDIPGNIGLLGDDYAGYYPVGDERALAQLMRRTETDPVFYQRLAAQIRRLQPQFRPERERRAWRDLLREMFQSAGRNLSLPRTRSAAHAAQDETLVR